MQDFKTVYLENVETRKIKHPIDHGTHKLYQLRLGLLENLLALSARLLLSIPGNLKLAKSLEDLVGLRSMLLFECFIALPSYGWCDICRLRRISKI